MSETWRSFYRKYEPNSPVYFADTVDALTALFAVWSRLASKGRSNATNHSWLYARQATDSLAHIVRKAWTGPERCRNGHESAVRVQSWEKPLDGAKPCAREQYHSLCPATSLIFYDHINAQILTNVSDRVVRGEIYVTSTPEQKAFAIIPLWIWTPSCFVDRHNSLYEL